MLSINQGIPNPKVEYYYLYSDSAHTLSWSQIVSGLVSFSWVQAPAKEIFFVLKSDIKWGFFMYSNTLESYVINLIGHLSGQP